MNRGAWEQIKKSKNFNVNTYRRGLIALNISLMLSCIFVLLLCYIYLTEPEGDFYATSGIVPPITLQPLLAPNFTSDPLLPPDPQVEEVENKVIPE
ncbi:MAG: phosphoesterase [Legionella longbeachae]|nr:phosphoesterase [Legionella longbeachae]